ncbi:hypothetical protein BKA67DRAFT_690700 [Truncatella angustata]|uniref:Uncharacterized protein n=1 Tax=Truncatella angustata TaxID=152316 RepID=A0A9P8ZZF5_9PEZI|nr:uncharacterized protein BKA67DRAFT_690700 [Truncatella angustata]KAH6656003.1 hypothetical protein BKA67DRAFT_690700 [Truncatella angustata]
MLGGVAIVTGGGSGIGRDCTLAYAYEGVRAIIVADIDVDAAQSSADESRKLAIHQDFEAIAFHVDVSSETSVNDMVSAATKRYGRLDYLVNSAGIGVQNPAEIASSSVDELDRFHNVNVKGTFLCVKAATRVMQGQERRVIQGRTGPLDVGRGSIINLGSCNSFMATAYITQYTVAKHAVLGLTRNAALDNAKYGIRVNAVCPSWVDTPMIDRAIEGDKSLKSHIDSVVPLGRIASPEDVSNVVMFLSSDKSSYVTGVGLIVDGGATLTVHT